MLSREEQKQVNTLFWNTFRNFIKKHKSSNGHRINWLNYPSDVKDIYIRLQADTNGARLCLDLQSKDAGVQAILWEQLCELKNVMEKRMNMEGEWISDLNMPDGRTISRIVWSCSGLNYLKSEDHIQIFEHLKNTLVSFDLFYQEFKEILITLTD
jgi:hypothetical protein